MDATHPAYGAHPAQGWIRRSQTATLKSHRGRAKVTLNGALSWPAREVITREAGLITGAEMVAFFEQIEACHPMAHTISPVLGNATYKGGRSEAIPLGFALPGAGAACCRVVS